MYDYHGMLGCGGRNLATRVPNPLSNISGGFNACTTYLNETSSGGRKYAKDPVPPHRGTVPPEGGWTNQTFVQQQRRCGNRRGGDKKDLSGRGRYCCRYGRAHHRDHQCLGNFHIPTSPASPDAHEFMVSEGGKFPSDIVLRR